MSSEVQWFIEGYFKGLGMLTRVAVNRFPFQIGRKPGINFTATSRKTSRLHAVMERRDRQLYLRDTDSPMVPMSIDVACAAKSLYPMATSCTLQISKLASFLSAVQQPQNPTVT
ncbi:hypothetical protein BST95_10290 [Halioglobus japonicus]|uniref:FHA domain-containing protein n=1 Tax=Halioglobus japonicus TaxID=930805 RepID=A0AAP8MFH4_9GAMM|nr:FHA domain-containing protein [Halioglobus japonicus]AQA18563.1 hypothetical protein BST95_10290 [Halioglobus japonicus]PLW86587.1 hypothetical protein C0029_09320 [Halioglobus japonicus]GHD12104.1 hypothetical protein GCM10007052_12570 [Halioglobus japonicus]